MKLGFLLALLTCVSIPLWAQDEPEYRFGTTVVLPGGFKGDIYRIKKWTKQLPDFAKLKAIGSIYTSSLNIPQQNFLAGFPGVTKHFEWFAIDYTGRFWIEKPAAYQFELTADDGAILYIDGQMVVDNDGTHPAIVKAGSATLSKGIHTIRVSYFQGPKEELALILKVAGPGERSRVFSTDEFKPPPDADIAPGK